MPSPSGLASGDVRRHNLALVLEHLVRSGPVSRSEIATGTGLTRGSVTALVQILVEAGWLRESFAVGGPKGRPRTSLELAADDLAVIAVQIASDSAAVLATTIGGAELVRLDADYGGGSNPAAVLDVVAHAVDDAMHRLASLGRRVVDATVIVLAPVGGSPVRVLGDVSLGWRDVDVVGELRARIPGLRAIELRLSSDTPVAAGAELRRLGGAENAIYLKGDSNIGGALVVGGAPVLGAHGFGGSLGHVAVVPGGQRCACGQHGCLITVAGIPALLAAAGAEQELASLSPSAALAALVNRVEAGDPAAAAAWSGAVPWIGRTLRILAMAVDPEVIVIGGHWARLTASIAESFATDRPLIADDPGFEVTVIAGALGEDAGLRGAVEAARDRLIRDPLAPLV
jgi:predicted NBD/HSP70 family sugar kinase